MLDRVRNLLHYFINVVVGLTLLVLGCFYVGVSGALVTGVINDLRLDTYVDARTGCAIVLVILLLGWAPLWVSHSVRRP
jgi:hypothetical protein